MGRTEEQSVQSKDNNRVEVEKYETINDLVNAMKRNAMLFGMSMEEFWYDNPQNFYLRGEVYKKRQEEKAEAYDYIAWRIGLYTMLGTQQTLTTRQTRIFPREPFSAEQVRTKGLSLREKIMAGVKRHNEINHARKALLQGDNKDGC